VSAMSFSARAQKFPDRPGARPANSLEVSRRKKNNIFLEKNLVKTGENYSFDWIYCQPCDPQPRPQLRHDVERGVLRAAECGVVPFPHFVVLPPVDVHRAHPFKAGGPVRRQVVEPQVAHLQTNWLVI
jgi:hypothetical protein